MRIFLVGLAKIVAFLRAKIPARPRRHTRAYRINRNQPENSILVHDKNSRFGDATLFSWIEYAPRFHDFAVGIAQNPERKSELLPESFGTSWRVNRNAYDIRTSLADFAVQVTILGQLAKAIGSPVSR